MRRSQLDIQVAAGAVVVAVAGLSLGVVFAWAGILLAAGGAVVYFALWRRPNDHDSGRNNAETSALDWRSRDVLWADTEQALRVLDRYPADDELAESVTALARLGRRAVERGRKAPADAAAVRARHVLCLAAETLDAFRATDKSRRHKRRARMRQLLDQAAETIARDADSKAEGETLCVHLRVLEQELKSTQTKG